MSDVQQQDFDMIHAKLSQWREDPGVEGIGCMLIARRTEEDRDESLDRMRSTRPMPASARSAA